MYLYLARYTKSLKTLQDAPEIGGCIPRVNLPEFEDRIELLMNYIIDRVDRMIFDFDKIKKFEPYTIQTRYERAILHTKDESIEVWHRVE